MTYPPVITLSALDSLYRALQSTEAKALYVLGAGGRNPTADTCFTFHSKLKKIGSDCIGFVLWCWGIDRYQPVDGVGLEYPFYDGWINTDSLLMDVNGAQLYFKEVYNPYPGCAIVYPSEWKNGKMIRMGHIGIVVEVNGSKDSDVVVVDCASALKRKLLGKAIARDKATKWTKIKGWKYAAPVTHSEASMDHNDVTPILPVQEPEQVAPTLGQRTLKLNARGYDVKLLQKLLGITVDGIYGPKTEAAVKTAQKRARLKVDGIVGAKTLAYLVAR